MNSSYNHVVLVNPPWDYQGSRYWACPEPHLPLELLYAQVLLRQGGVEASLLDAHMEELSLQQTVDRLGALNPDLIILTTAPTYLFWRCAPPELKVPMALSKALHDLAPIVAIGPHGSATPGYVLDKLECTAVVRGEPELELVRIARGEPAPSTIWANSDRTGKSAPATVDVSLLPALDFVDYPLEKHSHRHHVFWGEGRGAEVEFSRGCPYGCTFCNRRFFRSRFRSRPIEKVLAELRALGKRGVDYVYFIDEVFGLGKARGLLDVLAQERPVRFGCQTRLDLWDEGSLESLAAAGCVSVEFGLESPFPDQQRSINKGYEIEDERILELMAYAKKIIPWVQGDLIQLTNDPELKKRTEDWRQKAISRGVWISEPVQLFLYPGSDLHDAQLGPIDEGAWERALEASEK